MLSMWNYAPDFQREGCTTAVLPVGALEQHGSHLPVGTDTLIAEAWAQRVAADLHAYLLPALPITSSIEHSSNRGTVYIKASTLALVIRDIAESLQLAGYNRLILLNGHGGNWILKPTIRQLNRDLKPFKAILIWESVAAADNLRLMEHPQHDIHAGEHETSVMQHLHPEAVRQPVPRQDADWPLQDCMDYLDTVELTGDGYWGYPELANPEKGEQLLAALVRGTLDYLDRLEQTLARAENARQE